MRHIFEAILKLPDLTHEEWTKLLLARELLSGKNLSATRLENSVQNGSILYDLAKVKSFIAIDPIYELINTIDRAWFSVQKRLGYKRKIYNDTVLENIIFALLPSDISEEECKLLQERLAVLGNQLVNRTGERNDAVANLEKALLHLESSIYRKFRNDIIEQSPATNKSREEICTEATINHLKLQLTAEQDQSTYIQKKLAEESQLRTKIDNQKTLTETLQLAGKIQTLRKLSSHIALQNKEKFKKDEEAKRLNQEMAATAQRLLDQQAAMKLAYEINTEFRKYKTELKTYIKSAIKKVADAETYTGYFNTIHVDRKVDKISHIKTLLDESSAHESKSATKSIKEKSKSNTDSAQLINPPKRSPEEINITNVVRNNFELVRAIAIYKLIDDADNALHPVHAVNPQPVQARLANLYKTYPNIEKNLQDVGDEAVDKATQGIKGFFKKIWSNITWCFSKAKQKTQELVTSVKQNRHRFYQLTGCRDEIYLKEKQQNSSLVRMGRQM